MPVALAFTSIALITAIAVISWIRWEHQGKGELSSQTIVLVWGVYFVIVAATSLSAILGAWPLDLPVVLEIALGVSLSSVGLALGLWGIVSLRSVPGRPLRLIQGGAFRFSRNPQSTGIALSLLGISLLMDSGLALIAALGFWAALRAYTDCEESHLLTAFGVTYKHYRRRTPRFLGLPR